MPSPVQANGSPSGGPRTMQCKVHVFVQPVVGRDWMGNLQKSSPLGASDLHVQLAVDQPGRTPQASAFGCTPLPLWLVQAFSCYHSPLLPHHHLQCQRLGGSMASGREKGEGRGQEDRQRSAAVTQCLTLSSRLQHQVPGSRKSRAATPAIVLNRDPAPASSSSSDDRRRAIPALDGGRRSRAILAQQAICTSPPFETPFSTRNGLRLVLAPPLGTE
ncbi:hypothetical protein HDV57DRAFT_326726 [Trichoderma longibrachiatum]|uniref:Uncharacterized protein n=1 Tax=Trichoderma longibrachiatum ATCC 18648 TaxID=983965 RepID=A0A2T4BVU8_TRILO|nr:hypothetical protein M440DRAFT_1062839 [Trichoderma longibrachiatum ATCC 18648]